MPKGFSILIFLSLIIGQNLIGQSTFNKTNKGIVYRVFESVIDSTFCNNISIKSNNSFSTLEELVKQESKINNDKLILMNACISDSVGNCIGLLVSKGIEKIPINLNSGSGNFYLQPNGVLYFSKGDANIIQSSDFIKSDLILNAVQSGPMLVKNDSINVAFSPTSLNRNLRSGVGLYVKDNIKRIVFALSEKPVTFYEIASFFIDQYKCNNALSLESANTIM